MTHAKQWTYLTVSGDDYRAVDYGDGNLWLSVRRKGEWIWGPEFPATEVETWQAQDEDMVKVIGQALNEGRA